MEMLVQREERHGSAFESFLRDRCGKEEYWDSEGFAYFLDACMIGCAFIVPQRSVVTHQLATRSIVRRAICNIPHVFLNYFLVLESGGASLLPNWMDK